MECHVYVIRAVSTVYCLFQSSTPRARDFDQYRLVFLLGVTEPFALMLALNRQSAQRPYCRCRDVNVRGALYLSTLQVRVRVR